MAGPNPAVADLESGAKTDWYALPNKSVPTQLYNRHPLSQLLQASTVRRHVLTVWATKAQYYLMAARVSRTCRAFKTAVIVTW